MGFLEKATTILTGKNFIERRQEAEANKIIRREALTAQLQQRKESAIAFAKEKEKFAYERKIKELRKPKPSFGGFGSYGTPFGQPRISRPQAMPKKKKSKSKQRYQEPQSTYAPPKLDLIGGSSGMFRVI